MPELPSTTTALMSGDRVRLFNVRGTQSDVFGGRRGGKGDREGRGVNDQRQRPREMGVAHLKSLWGSWHCEGKSAEAPSWKTAFPPDR